MQTPRKFHKPLLATVLSTLLLPSVALAHPGDAAAHHNLMEGLLHPLTGFDHLLMITAVGAWAGQLMPRGRLLVAVCLALFVGIGAVLNRGAGPLLEIAIAFTVLGSGLLLALGRRWPLWAGGLLAAGFALVHGLAHGTEGPAHSAAYLGGLIVATGMHALLVATLASRLQQRGWLLRSAGLVTAATAAVNLAS